MESNPSTSCSVQRRLSDPPPGGGANKLGASNWAGAGPFPQGGGGV